MITVYIILHMFRMFHPLGYDPQLTTTFFWVAQQPYICIVGEQSNFDWCCNHTYVSAALSKSKNQLNE